MTETIESMVTPIDQLQLAQQLVEQARGCEVLARGAHRDQEPRRRGCLHHCLRRTTRAADAVTTVWPQAIVQACIIHLIRNIFRYASRRDWDAISKDLRPVYMPTEPSAAARFAEITERWAGQYRRSSRSGATPGPSSSRSWTTTSRSAGSSAPPMRSIRSTPATGERSARAGTFRPNRPP